MNLLTKLKDVGLRVRQIAGLNKVEVFTEKPQQEEFLSSGKPLGINLVKTMVELVNHCNSSHKYVVSEDKGKITVSGMNTWSFYYNVFTKKLPKLINKGTGIHCVSGLNINQAYRLLSYAESVIDPPFDVETKQWIKQTMDEHRKHAKKQNTS